MNEEQKPPQFPQYPPPAMATRQQAAPLQKLIGRRFSAKVRTPKKGLHSSQNVSIKHKKVKYY